MRYFDSTGVAKGVISRYFANLTFVLLPHDRYTSNSTHSPISRETVIAHCLATKAVRDKLSWMVEADLSVVDKGNPVKFLGGNW